MKWRTPGPEETAPYSRALDSIGAVSDAAGETVLLPDGSRRKLALWGDVDAADQRAEAIGLVDEVDRMGGTQDILALVPMVDAALGRRLHERNVAYLDSQGNARIHASGLHIHVEGRRSNPAWRRARNGAGTAGTRSGTLSTPAGLRVVFALLEAPALRRSTVRDIAGAALVSIGTAQQVLRVMRDEGYLRDTAVPARSLGRREDLVRLWAIGYRERLVRTLESRFVTAPGAVTALVESLRGDAGVTLAGDALAPAIKNGTGVVVFGEPPWGAAIRAGRLRTAVEQTEVVLRQRFWDETALQLGSLASPLLMAGELLCTSDPRLREAGERMIADEACHD
ncbi:type IV toxin-antitoxin system AbiEi family antitoxin [Micrococcus luteus]|uniref:type IV toxin-antitoxin system AbiEi family antitoxin n=1 Tax=Micrococcus luteus TaxID=1270 RepID=UPI000DFF07DB|nr:type IV toxin-antitoxin system AbiEi family antitoxin [Micrococcus luteus]STY69781.1 Uncharacterised protein [Micrococcus luteus]